jgi:hypothetical protein
LLIVGHRYSVPVYFADGSTPRYDVDMIDHAQSGATVLHNVPIPSGVSPAAGNDGHMSIIDNSTGCVYDLFEAYTVGGVDGGAFDFSNPRANWAQRAFITGTGWVQGASVRGSSAMGLGGLLRASDFTTPSHALALVVPGEGPSQVFPSYTSDGGTSGGLPAGARVRLSASFVIPSTWTAAQKVLARTLQIYGAYVVDQGGGSESYFLALDDKGAIDSGITNYTSLPSAMLTNLRVVGPQQATTETYAPIFDHPCANFD